MLLRRANKAMEPPTVPSEAACSLRSLAAAKMIPPRLIAKLCGSGTTIQMLNIFVSRPTTIEPAFESAYTDFDLFLTSKNIRSRRLGGGDYSRQAPLKAVFRIIDECCGAIILGYPQLTLRHEVRRSAKPQNDWGYVLPTPWNQIEGALAYRAETPVLVIAHHGIEGGVFDFGVTGEGVTHLDLSAPKWFLSPQFEQPFAEWLAEVGSYTTTNLS